MKTTNNKVLQLVNPQVRKDAIEHAGTAVDVDDVEFDESGLDTALCKRAVALVETLYRQRKQFFLRIERRFAWGGYTDFENGIDYDDCSDDSSEIVHLSDVQAAKWMKSHCIEREDVDMRISELDRMDGVSK